MRSLDMLGMSSTIAFQCATLLKSGSHSLPNTKIFKYIPKNLIGGYFTGDFT